MKALLTAMQTALAAGCPDLTAVFITEDENLIPAAMRFPAAGLKDGPVTRKEKAGEVLERKLSVSVVLWVRLLRGQGASVIGDPSVSQKGVLDLSADVHAVLDGNLLDLPGMQAAFCRLERASEFFTDEKEGLIKRVLVYEYEQETSRP